MSSHGAAKGKRRGVPSRFSGRSVNPAFSKATAKGGAGSGGASSGGGGGAGLHAQLRRARQTGKLVLAQRELTAVPDDVFRIDELVRPRCCGASILCRAVG